MFNIYFIAAHGENFRRLPEFLAGPDVRITLICCSESMLRKSKFIDEVIAISQHPHCADFIEKLTTDMQLLDRIDGWVIFASDDEMYGVAHSEITLDLKHKLLPFRKAEFFPLLNSKSKFVEACIEAGSSIPRSVIVETPVSLSNALKDFTSRVVIKRDQGAGGAGVRVIATESELDDEPIPDSWFPLVLQEYIPGDPRGVDAFFREGHLVAWMYCDNLQFPTKYGPTVTRRYVDPPTLDFEESLQRFAKTTGAHGFANCSSFYLEEENRHLLFEVDMRTNAWHYYGPFFGLKWSNLMAKPLDEVISEVQRPRNIPKTGVQIIHWQRFAEYAVLNREWKTLFRLLRMKEADRSPVTFKDTAISRTQLLGLFRLGVLSFAKMVYETLPVNWQIALKRRGNTARFASRVTTR
jgi:hypothetical protein